jgi:two-component system sensor histidine kinase KdpD
MRETFSPTLLARSSESAAGSTQPGRATGGAGDRGSGQKSRAVLIDAIARDVSRPLAAIAGAAAVLRKGTSPSAMPVQEELIDTVERQAECLERFVATLVDFAKLECSALDLRRESADLKDVIAGAVRKADPELADRQLQIILPADLGRAVVDRAILEKALVILIDHTAHQTPAGSTVTIQAGRDDKAVRIQVLDGGEGIAPEELGELFEKHGLVTPEDRMTSGAGLHMAVCHRLVDATGGTITAANRTDGCGAVFTITFPLAAGS